MMLTKEQKDKIIKKFKTHESDTGSPEVQIAILTEEIIQLTDHLKSHKKDFSSRRGLLRKVGMRRRLFKHLQKEDQKSAEELSKKLKLKIIITPSEATGFGTPPQSDFGPDSKEEIEEETEGKIEKSS
ncbi:MAG TPA: 30S ribosomal protein S15 [Candidatus Kerfeldbacteria bacterium]|nr:30S ribosomal protein S15 [Candidatus Kerfeldbacteria bacterium]